jgi:hypothetical protein
VRIGSTDVDAPPQAVSVDTRNKNINKIFARILFSPFIEVYVNSLHSACDVGTTPKIGLAFSRSRLRVKYAQWDNDDENPHT